MSQILITFTRTHRLPMPKPLPVVTEQEARQWFSGWWNGIAIGLVSGVGIGVLSAGVFA